MTTSVKEICPRSRYTSSGLTVQLAAAQFNNSDEVTSPTGQDEQVRSESLTAICFGSQTANVAIRVFANAGKKTHEWKGRRMHSPQTTARKKSTVSATRVAPGQFSVNR